MDPVPLLFDDMMVRVPLWLSALKHYLETILKYQINYWFELTNDIIPLLHDGTGNLNSHLNMWSWFSTLCISGLYSITLCTSCHNNPHICHLQTLWLEFLICGTEGENHPRSSSSFFNVWQVRLVEDIPEIFQAFYRLSTSVQYSGLHQEGY